MFPGIFFIWNHEITNKKLQINNFGPLWKQNASEQNGGKGVTLNLNIIFSIPEGLGLENKNSD